MSKIKIMLVDDEVTVIEGFKKLFNWEEHGCTIICQANDGMSAVSLAKQYKPDIVFMDINIPLLSGLEAIHQISLVQPSTAFIVVTGYNEFEYAREALRLKVADYLLKPVNFSELDQVLQNVKRQLLHKRATQSDAHNNEYTKLSHEIITFLHNHLADDISLKQLAEVFHHHPSHISRIFKQETGMNYHTYLTQLRINEAQKLLISSNLSIAEISFQVGFNDYRSFTQMFKKITNMTPSECRNSEK